MLIALGVGHPKVDLICTTLARYGIHPKMTGAGGGGSVFAFLKPSEYIDKENIEKKNKNVWIFKNQKIFDFPENRKMER